MKKKYYNSTSFLDMLFNCLLGFVFMFAVTFIMVNPQKEESKLQTQAEFLITLTWEMGNPDDVDIWVQDPTDGTLFFRNKEVGLMHLDRDDVGIIRDKITLFDGSTISYPYNQEIVTIRGFIAGDWVVNVHLYAKRQPKPTVAQIRMDKLNPSVKTVFLKSIELHEKWEEHTVSRFSMTPKGEIEDLNDLPIKLIGKHLERTNM